MKSPIRRAGFIFSLRGQSTHKNDFWSYSVMRPSMESHFRKVYNMITDAILGLTQYKYNCTNVE